MKKVIVCLSDTHLRHHFEVPEGDVVVHAGDATFRGDEREIREFASWYSKLPHKHKIFVAGNHDWGFQKKREYFANLLALNGIIYLQDEAVELEGIKFYGSPWQPEFCNWAFNLSRYEGELAERWSQIPDDTDVLITHGPPQNILDLTSDRYHAPDNVGCYDLARRVEQLKNLKLHVFGHIHHSYGYKEVGDTKFVNASICDESYRPVNPPVVIEL